MAAAVEQVELGAFPRGDLGQEAGALNLRGADLQVRIARPAQRAGTEERAPEIRAAAAAAGEHAQGRTLERAVRAVEHAGSVERLVGVRDPSTWSW